MGAGTGCATVRTSHLPRFNGEVPCPPRTARRVTSLFFPFFSFPFPDADTLPSVSNNFDYDYNGACVPCACCARKEQGKWARTETEGLMPIDEQPPPTTLVLVLVLVQAQVRVQMQVRVCVRGGQRVEWEHAPINYSSSSNKIDISEWEVPSSALGRLISRGHLQSCCSFGAWSKAGAVRALAVHHPPPNEKSQNA